MDLIEQQNSKQQSYQQKYSNNYLIMPETNYEKIIQDILHSNERQTDKLLSYIQNNEKEKNKRKSRTSNRIFAFLTHSKLTAILTNYLINRTFKTEDLSDENSQDSTEKNVLTNDIPLIVCCKWLNYFFETNELLQSFIKKTLRKVLYDKFITLVNSATTNDFEINLKDFKEEIDPDDIKDLNTIDPRLSAIEKILLIKIING